MTTIPPAPGNPEQINEPSQQATSEIQASYNALTARQVKRLKRFARLKMLVLRSVVHDADAGDLLHEALKRTLKGEELQNNQRQRDCRRWNRQVLFVTHLYSCMESIANDWFEKASRHVQFSEENHSKPNRIIPEVQARMIIEDLKHAFRYDSLTLSIIQLLCEEHSPKEIRQTLGIDSNAFNAARKRISRFLERQYDDEVIHA